MQLIQSLAIACMISVFVLSCETVPLIVSVDKRQDYTMPSEFWIHGLGGLTMDEIADNCEGNINGCLIRLGDDEFVIYYRTHNVADHEFDHILYGDKHSKRINN